MAVCSYMATISMGKTDVVRQNNTSVSTSSKISRVCFTLANSNYSKGHVTSDRKRYVPCNAGETVDDLAKSAGDLIKDAVDVTNKTTGEMFDKAKGDAEYLKKQASDDASKFGEKAEETKNWAMDAAQDADKKNKDNLASIGDKASEVREETIKNATEALDAAEAKAKNVKEVAEKE